MTYWQIAIIVFSVLSIGGLIALYWGIVTAKEGRDEDH